MDTDIRILMAEDDAYDASLARLVMEGTVAEHGLLTVTTGKEALDYLHRRGAFAGRPLPQPAVVLLDLKMPGMDGFQVLELMKSDPALQIIPVVVLTSSRNARDLTRAYELGVNGYVVKDLDFHIFTASLKALIRFWLEVNEAPPTCFGHVRP
jgi:CheY-like chemotaxis protein